MDIIWTPEVYCYFNENRYKSLIIRINENEYSWKIKEPRVYYHEDVKTGCNSTLQQAYLNLIDYHQVRRLGIVPDLQDFRIIRFKAKVGKYKLMIEAREEGELLYAFEISGGMVATKTCFRSKEYFTDLAQIQIAAEEIAKFLSSMEKITNE